LAKRALEIRRQELGSEHLDTALSSNQLGRLYFELAAYVEAEAFYQQARAIRAKVLGPEHPDTARSLSNLPGVYVKTGAYSKAEKTYLRATAILKKVLGPTIRISRSCCEILEGYTLR
jgi:tetratricopeptide (TPR) repeat protein